MILVGMAGFILVLSIALVNQLSKGTEVQAVTTTPITSEPEVQIVTGVVIEETTEENVDDTSAEEAQEVLGTQVLEGTEVEETTEETTWMDYTSADVNLLANIMYAEEGVLYTKYMDTEPTNVEMVFKLCGSVVLHRLANQMDGATTIREVLYASPNGNEQYAGTTKTRVENGQDIPDIVFTWAEQLLKDGPLGPNNLVFQSEFVQGDSVYATYWNQIFCTCSCYPEEEQ